MKFNEVQEHASSQTSIAQVPAVYKKMKFEPSSAIVDYGCGRYFDTLVQPYIEQTLECQGVGYDLTWQPDKSKVEKFIANNGLDYVVCANVLNVIDDDNVIGMIASDIKLLSQDKDPIIYFGIYEGDRSGIGRATGGDKYQRNMKAREYVPMLERYFSSITVSGNILICRK